MSCKIYIYMQTFMTFYVHNHVYLYQSTRSSQSEIVSLGLSHTHTFSKPENLALHCKTQ